MHTAVLWYLQYMYSCTYTVYVRSTVLYSCTVPVQLYKFKNDWGFSQSKMHVDWRMSGEFWEHFTATSHRRTSIHRGFAENSPFETDRRTDRHSSSPYLPTEVPTDRMEHVPTEGRLPDRGIHNFTYRAKIVMSSVGMSTDTT